MVKDFVVLNLAKRGAGFWKDDFGTIKEVSSYSAEELVENITRIKEENQEKKLKLKEDYAKQVATISEKEYVPENDNEKEPQEVGAIQEEEEKFQEK